MNPLRKQYAKSHEDWVWSFANTVSKFMVESAV